jgi:hypothetical protein
VTGAQNRMHNLCGRRRHGSVKIDLSLSGSNPGSECYGENVVLIIAGNGAPKTAETTTARRAGSSRAQESIGTAAFGGESVRIVPAE